MFDWSPSKTRTANALVSELYPYTQHYLFSHPRHRLTGNGSPLSPEEYRNRVEKIRINQGIEYPIENHPLSQIGTFEGLLHEVRKESILAQRRTARFAREFYEDFEGPISPGNLTTSFLFRDSLHKTNTAAVDYTIDVIKNLTEENSEFGQLTRGIKSLPSQQISLLLPNFQREGYDMLIGRIGPNFLGHMAFQEKARGEQKDWEMFSCYVRPAYRGRGMAAKLGTDLVEKGLELSVSRIRMGKGHREEMDKIMKKVQGKNPEIVLDSEGWIVLRPTKVAAA